MPSFGDFMIDDFLRSRQQAEQNYLQTYQNATNTAQQISSQQSEMSQQAIQNGTQQVAQGIQQATTAHHQQQELNQQQHALALREQEHQAEQAAKNNAQQEKTAHAYGKSLAFQGDTTTKINAAWPDNLKQAALDGYTEGKGLLAYNQQKSDITKTRQLETESVKQKNRYDISNFRSGQSVKAAIDKWKQTGGDVRLLGNSIKPLFAELGVLKGLKGQEKKDLAAKVLKQAGLAGSQINDLLKQGHPELMQDQGQQLPSTQTQSAPKSRAEQLLDSEDF